MPISEATIRDHLAESLDLLEKGLTLLDIERYVPNAQGTRGFIDILAKDSQGRYVLIELKRSDASSRQAIHEVLKYVEGVKTNLAVREDELRLFVVSTEWAELLVPFSSFVQRVSISTRGYALTVDNDGQPTNATLVTPLAIREERLFSPWHSLNLYRSAASLQQGIQSYESTCAKKGIQNFVLVVLVPPEGHREYELQSVKNALEAIQSEKILSIDEVAKMVPEHTGMLYFAMLQLSSDECVEKVIASNGDPEDLEEFLGYIESMEGDELSCTLQEKLLDIEPIAHNDYFEIGTPAKFGTKILDGEGWVVQEILRYGTIKKNELLSDHTIIAELRGEQGVTGQRYVKEFIGAEPSQLNVLKEELKRCLVDNPIWSRHLQVGVDAIAERSSTAKTRASVYNPSNALLAIYQVLARENGALYLPSYHITTEDGDITQMVFGIFVGTGRKPSMKQIVQDHYDGDPGHVLWPLNWGGYQEFDAFVARDAGLTYKTYKLIVEGASRTFFELTELGWEACDAVDSFTGFQTYVEENADFVDDVMTFFSGHWNGFMTTYQTGEVNEFKT